MNTTTVFGKLAEAWLDKPRYILLEGGTRSGKTYSALQLLFVQCLGEEKRKTAPTITSIVSESMPHLKRGAIRDFKTILTDEGAWMESRWNETDKTYSFANGSLIEFFSVDNAGKVYGSARDRLFVNEAQHIGLEIFRQLAVRTRERIVIDYNPTHEFWAITDIARRPGCVSIHSTYKDNQFLTPEQVAEIESNRDDRNWWRVFGEGKVGTLDGLIYDIEIIPALPSGPEASGLVEVQGMDFGFTNDPTARVRCLVDTRRKIIYADERCYATRMQNRHIIDDLRADGVGRSVPIYADCAEPKSIADIADAGFNVIPCSKDAPVSSDKLRFQIQWMQGWRLLVTAESLNVIREARNYTWAKDRDGKPLNQPIDKFNHALDAIRYAVWTHFGREAGAGQYTVSIYGKRIV